MRLFTASSRTPAGFTLTAPVSMPARSRRQRNRRAAASTASTTAPSLPGVDGSTGSANDGHYFSVAMDDKVRILRRDVGDRARMVLSGRMADVCAALERMSRAEAVSCAG